MEKDKKKEAERHRAFRLKKKERETKLETLYTFLERYYSGVLAQFERFYSTGTIPTSVSASENPAEKSPPLDPTAFKDGVKPSPEPQDILPTTTGDDVSWSLSEIPGPEQSTLWDNIWDDSLPELGDIDFDLEAYLNADN